MFVEHYETGGKTTEIDLARPSRAALVKMLREPGLRPKGFGPWNYRHCSTCAIGLAQAAWGDWICLIDLTNGNPSAAFAIFYVGSSDTTADDVADALERLG